MPTLLQLLNQIVRAAVWRAVWMLPRWAVLGIVGLAFAYALLVGRH
jgi:hypothetical protein